MLVRGTHFTEIQGSRFNTVPQINVVSLFVVPNPAVPLRGSVFGKWEF